MDQPPEIIDLAKVVEPHLNGRKLLSYSSHYLTKPGDNYGSIMLALSANIQKSDGSTEEMPLVAKLPPLTNEMFWHIFKPEITSLRENAIYVKVAPAVRQLQLDNGIPEDDLMDVFAKSYGCRISLDEKATVLDRDAVLVLENLQTNGYKAGKRQIMFDYEHIRLVLKFVAQYHALPIALRKLQPDKFKIEILPNFYRYDVSMGMDQEVQKQFSAQLFGEIELALGGDEKALERCKELDAISQKYMSNTNQCEDGPFTTIAHYDMWINNFLIKYDETGAPSKLKIVDFQIAQYESLAHDLIFLFFSSVDTGILEKHFDDLLRYYYEEFINCLQKTTCNTDEYSYDKFFAEVQKIAPFQIIHALFMSRVLLADDKSMPEDFKDYNMETMQNSPSEALLKKMSDIIRLSQKFGFFW